MIIKDSIIRQVKFLIIFLLVSLSLVMIIYFHHILHRTPVFTHFFYLPIILASLWWGMRGFSVALGLAVMLVASNFLMPEYITDRGNYIRAAMLLVTGLIVAFLTERIKSQEKKTNEAIKESRLLQKEIMQITEKERQRIGQDLHDGIGQNLTASTFLIEALRNRIEQGIAPGTNEIEEIKKIIKNSIVQTRSIAKVLSPVEMDKYGLNSAIEEMVSSIEKVFDITCNITGNILIEDNETAIHLYYIIREAVTNAIKHGLSKNIHIMMKSGKKAEISIIDDGTGSKDENNKTGMGLRIMKYRANIIGAGLVAGNRKEGGFEVKIRL